MVISEVRKHMYLGDAQAAQSPDILRKYSIYGIVSAVDWIQSVPPTKLCIALGVQRIIYPIPDGLFVDPGNELVEHVFPLIKEYEDASENILIHCYKGRSRSASLAITYIIWRLLQDPEITRFPDAYASAFGAALELVMNQHSIACPHPQTLRSFLACIERELPIHYSDLYATMCHH